jgi:hypothetical protein
VAETKYKDAFQIMANASKNASSSNLLRDLDSNRVAKMACISVEKGLITS